MVENYEKETIDWSKLEIEKMKNINGRLKKLSKSHLVESQFETPDTKIQEGCVLEEESTSAGGYFL